MASQPQTTLPPLQQHLDQPQLSSPAPYSLVNEPATNLWAAAGRSNHLRSAPKRGEEMLSAPTERAKRKKLMRQGQKDLLILLDSLLHVGDGGALGTRSAHKNILEAALGAALSLALPPPPFPAYLVCSARALLRNVPPVCVRARDPRSLTQ